jgi:small subunit ribosomal protein S5
MYGNRGYGGRRDAEPSEFNVRIVQTNKVFKTHKGGKTASWNALVVVGDGKGRVGAGLGKARGIPDAIRKAEEVAKKALIQVPMIGSTLPHEIVGRMGASQVVLKPASPGTGVVAGGAVRAVLELAGVRDVLGKSIGSRNAINVAWATLRAIKALKEPEKVAAARGKKIEYLMPWYRRAKEAAENA